MSLAAAATAHQIAKGHSLLREGVAAAWSTVTDTEYQGDSTAGETRAHVKQTRRPLLQS